MLSRRNPSGSFGNLFFIRLGLYGSVGERGGMID